MDDLNPITRTERLLDGEDLTPTNREEMFIRRIYDKTQEIPEPVNRKEYFLKKAGEASGDVTVVPLSVTSNGIYSEEGKAYSPVTVEVSPPEDSYQLKSITTPTSLATFEASAMPMPKLKVSVEAKQDLHGYDKPWVGGSGKNKLPMTVDSIKSANPTGTWSGNSYTVNGVTFTIQTDTDGNVTGIKANGTANADITFLCGFYILKAGSSIKYNGSVNGSLNTFWVVYHGYPKAPDRGDGIADRTSASTDWDSALEIGITNGTSLSNQMFYPMIRLATETDATFVPYSNICPITGWDAVVVSDVDDVDNPTVTQTTTISLPQTVYGAEVDVVNGTSGNKLTHGFETIRGGITSTDSSGKLFVIKDLSVPSVSDYNTATPYIISNYLTPYSVNNLRVNAVFGLTQYNKRLYVRLGDEITTVADANTYLASNPLQVKYELKDPTTFVTQPTPIKSLNGLNNLSVDSGDVIEGEYFKALGGE